MCARKWGCSPRCGWYPEGDDDDGDDNDDGDDDVVLGVGGTLRGDTQMLGNRRFQ